MDLDHPAARPRTSRFALANEYPAQQQQQGTGTGTADDSRSKIRCVYGYHFVSQSSPGAYAWYCASTIGNAHTPAQGASANTNGHWYFRPPSVAARRPSCAGCCSPPSNWHYSQRRPTDGRFSIRPKSSRQTSSKTTNSPFPACLCSQRPSLVLGSWSGQN